jgi:hypothetical protein
MFTSRPVKAISNELEYLEVTRQKKPPICFPMVLLGSVFQTHMDFQTYEKSIGGSNKSRILFKSYKIVLDNI